jgi:hypothetical protein
MTSPETHRIKGRVAMPEASVTQPEPVGGGEKIDRRVCLASQTIHVVCLAIDVEVA